MTVTAKKRNVSNHPMNLKKEMWGVVLLGMAGLLGGGLLSLQAGDGRLMGPFGQLLSLGLYALLGMGSYLVILALFSVSWGIFTNRFAINDIKLWSGYSGATISGTILMFLMFPAYRLQGLSAGGKTGEFLGSMGISLFSKVGTFLIASTLMVLFLVLATQASPASGTRALARMIAKGLKLFAAGAIWLFTGFVTLFSWEESEEIQVEENSMDETQSDENIDKEVKTEKSQNSTTDSDLQPESATACETSPQTDTQNKIEDPIILPAVSKEDKKITANITKNKKSKKADKVVKKTKSPTVVKKQKSPTVANPSIKIGVVELPTPSVSSDYEESLSIEILESTPILDEPIISTMEKSPVETMESLSGFTDVHGEFILPDPEVLNYVESENSGINKDLMISLSEKMVSALSTYKIKGNVTEIHPGPVVTMYEFAPEAGIRVSKIESLNKDLALSLAATRVRIVAPIPGKAAVGIEVPNKHRQTVFIKEGIADPGFQNSKSKLTMILGKDIKGKPTTFDLGKAPHLLVAGATGSGKSVGINTMIISMLFRATPRDLRFIMIDPKMVELSIYNDIPHLLLPVVTDPQKANLALQWAVKEMERRYMLLSELNVRNLDDYNKTVEELKERGISETPEHLPYIVIVIDEFADLMMVAAKDVEIAVARIAQKARAIGIHLILATQRPSTDVITGLIKSNFPSRIAFMVSSRIDSKVVLDKHGAETLLGNGDMLFSNRGLDPVRVHGSYVSTSEVQKVVDHLKAQGTTDYDLSITDVPQEEMPDLEDEPYDTKWDLALDIISRDRIASISYLQRKLKIGYNRSARMIERMEIEGIVSRPNGTNQREVLITNTYE
jgi:DNA segregation ATPase FtsK/SpoIIIE, S-DNA-T family